MRGPGQPIEPDKTLLISRRQIRISPTTLSFRITLVMRNLLLAGSAVDELQISPKKAGTQPIGNGAGSGVT
jgi:hypothetical protein